MKPSVQNAKLAESRKPSSGQPSVTIGEAVPGFKEALEISKNRKVSPELKAQSDKLVKAAVRNLNYNSVRDNPEVR